MTDLRQKMIRAMELKNLSDNTQRAYLADVTGIASYYNQSPEKLTMLPRNQVSIGCCERPISWPIGVKPNHRYISAPKPLRPVHPINSGVGT